MCVTLSANGGSGRMEDLMRVRRLVALAFLALLFLLPGAAAEAQSPPSVAPTTLTRVEGTQVARTGTDVLPLVITGAALAGAGTILVVGARSRRSRAVAA
jgi:hypothetical protein